MVDDLWQPIADAIGRGDEEAVVKALERLDEADRRRLSSTAKRAAKQYGPEEVWSPGEVDERRIASARAADAAVFGTGGSAGATRTWWLATDQDLGERLIRCRPREWRQDWSNRAMSEREPSEWDWRIVHRMVKDRLIDRPSAPGYVVCAAAGMYEWIEGRRDFWPIHKPLAQTLRSEAEWLHDDLWRFFEVEEAGLSSRDLRQADSGAQTWQEALCELAAEGTIPRQRLLDESLAALRRDFSAHNARWFHKFYEALEPTDDEQLERLDELLALLAAPDPAVVGFALRALDKLERRKLLPGDRVLEAIAPALLISVKAHATRAIKLVRRILEREPGYASLAAPALVHALVHESRDIQEPIIDLLERHSDALGEEARTQLATRAADVDPAVRGRLDALTDEGGDQPAAAGVAATTKPAVAVPPRRLPGDSEPRLNVPRLAPVNDVDDLLERLAVALERGDDPDELELLLDGISRLRDQPVPEGRARALIDRASARSPIWEGQVGFHHARDALAVLVFRWLGEREYRKVQLSRTGRSPREAIALRVRELADDLPAGEARGLLSVPTHAGGWIDPHEAVARIRALSRARPFAMDLAQMVLRLAPDDRDRAGAAAAELSGEAAAIVAHALGGSSRRPFRSKLKPAWAAADHARDPAAFEIPRRALQDHEAVRASWVGREEVRVDPASPADLLVLEESWWGWQPAGIEGWLTRVWPANREGVFHLVARRLWMNMGTRVYGIEDVLEVLLDDAEPVRDQAALAVALALGSSDITHRALAADVAVAALQTRRLDGETLGTKFVLMLRRQKDAVPARWAASLADVAAAGPLAAHDVQVTIEQILAAADSDDRRRLVGLVDLLRRLAVEADAAVADPRARQWLSSLATGTKIGRAGKEALAVTGDGGARSRAAAEAAGV